MSYMQDSIDWQVIELVDMWLDSSVNGDYLDQPLGQDWARISKIAEELGEATAAFIGITGQNPRKGIHGSMDDLLDELADTALTAILAIQHFSKSSADTRQRLMSKQEKIYQRINRTSDR